MVSSSIYLKQRAKPTSVSSSNGSHALPDLPPFINTPRSSSHILVATAAYVLARSSSGRSASDAGGKGGEAGTD